MARVNLNAKQIELARCICTARDGYNCYLCRKSFGENLAQVHHLDGDPNNNPEDGSNWSLVHHTCNVLEYYVRKRLEIVDGERPPPFEYTIGSKFELRWMRWMIDSISKNGKVSWNEARYTGALEIDASPESTKRYLLKHVTKSDHPKALFKSRLNEMYETEIVFTEHTQEYMNKNDDLV